MCTKEENLSVVARMKNGRKTILSKKFSYLKKCLRKALNYKKNILYEREFKAKRKGEYWVHTSTIVE